MFGQNRISKRNNRNEVVSVKLDKKFYENLQRHRQSFIDKTGIPVSVPSYTKIHADKIKFPDIAKLINENIKKRRRS